jgi:hypothetical protein
VVGRGTSLREFNNAIFDAMGNKRGGVVRVGMGSGIYGFVGRWVPRGLVGWMMGVRKVNNECDFGRGRNLGGSRGTSPMTTSSHGSGSYVHGLNLGESEYISVYGEGGLDEDEYILNRNS